MSALPLAQSHLMRYDEDHQPGNDQRGNDISPLPFGPGAAWHVYFRLRSIQNRLHL